MTRKRALNAFVALLGCFVLAGCGNGQPKGEQGEGEKIAVTQQALPTDGQQCVTIQRGASGQVADATLWQNAPTWNDSTGPYLYAGPTTGGPLDRAILRFDLASIPQGATLTSASFSIYQRWKSQAETVNVHRVTAEWTEAAVRWGTFNDSFDPAPVGSFAIPGGGSTGWRSVNVLALAQGWVSGATPNHGIILNQPAGGLTEYRSSESSTTSQRPKLDVCYVTCSDGIQNGGETGVDCGGAACAPCGCVPSPEICDGIDNDCDGAVDDGLCGPPPDVCHQAGVCDPGGGQCTYPNAPDGTACNDGNACTQTDTCQAGACTGGNAVTCAASDACHVAGICDPATGACSNPAVPDGTACSDGNACTQTDSCQSGTCTGSNPVTCAAQDACHVAGTCDPATGACSNPAAPDGTACNDGNACTQTDSCQAGACTGGNAVTCAASDACHLAGTCNPATGVCSNPAAPNGTSCNDGNACTQTDSCQSGSCVGSSPVTCAASDACHVAGTCDPATGACSNPIAANGTACNDGNACTQTDSCQSGTCTGSNAVTCAASDACHVAGTCDPATGACSNPAAADGTSCDDGDACTQTDTCQAGACTGGNAVTCTASDACHVAGTCNPATGACSNPVAANGTACDDGNACTQTDSCQSGTCTGGNPVTCAASDACHVAGTCDPATGACSNPAAPNGTACSDGNACTQTDSCQGGTCTGSNPVTCAASDACHVAGTCDPATGACSNPAAPDGTSCSDGNACTQTDSCQSGACAGGNPVTCAAQDACHMAGTCDPATGACSNPVAANGTACDDGNACTQGDSCQSGACAGGNPVTCAAADACHAAGTCDPATGACSAGAALADGTACDDGNGCTQGDSCQAGACAAGAPVTCAPADGCHEAGACNAATGACDPGPALANGTACDDGNAGTQYDTCQNGACFGANSVVITITSPAEGSIASGDTVLVTGTLSEPATVRIGEVQATVNGTSFSATVPVHEGSNIIAVEATGQAGNPGSASVVVGRDTRPPRVSITQPADRALIPGNATTVTGSVQDMVIGAVGLGDCAVTVNGINAVVENGSFRADLVPVAEGAGTITVVATDAAGNAGSAVIEVTGNLASNAMIVKAGGDSQDGVVGTQVAQPLQVQLLDNTGQPVANRDVVFEVSRSNGYLGNGARMETVVSDAQGFASTTLVLGTSAGAGSDQVTAKAAGFLGAATFAANAVTDPTGERVLTVSSGGNQKGAPGALAPLPLAVFLSDGEGNPVANQDVTFTVTQGGGRVDGASTVVKATDADGRVRALLTMGSEIGDGTQIVQATATGSNEVVFVGSTRAVADPAQTTITGLVLTNENDPIANALVTIEGMPGVQGVTDAEGHFAITVPLPAGTTGYRRVHLDVVGATGGPFPSELEFELDLIPGAENTMERPVYLPAVDTNGVATASEAASVEIRRPDVPGFSLQIPAGSATFIEDGTCSTSADCTGGRTCVNSRCQSKTGQVQVITVHNDKIPMLPSDGSIPTLAFAIMPHTAHFDPPAPIRMPNVDGREPGEVVSLYSYDHDLGQFVIVGTATVSEDGQEIVSERGQGIVKGGWHYVPPKPVPTTCVITAPAPGTGGYCSLKVCSNATTCQMCRISAATGKPVAGTCTSAAAGTYAPDVECYSSKPTNCASPTCNSPNTRPVGSTCVRGYDNDQPGLSGLDGLCMVPAGYTEIMCCPTDNTATPSINETHICPDCSNLGGGNVCCVQECRLGANATCCEP